MTNDIYSTLPPALAAYEAAPLVRIACRSDAARLRREVTAYIWPDGNLPTGRFPAVTVEGAAVFEGDLKGVTPAGVGRVERLESRVEAGYRHVSYLLSPANASGVKRLAVLHQGHQGGLGDGIGELADRLLREGFMALLMQMPMFGWNTHKTFVTRSGAVKAVAHHNELFASWGDEAGSPLRFFIEPVTAGINLFLRRYPGCRAVAMIGLSGGGWTTHIAAALDDRIALSVAVAGSYPLFVRPYYPGSAGDAEQIVPGLYKERASWLDLYILGADAPGRKQIQLLNQYDPCCFYGVGARAYQDLVARAADGLGGRWTCVLDATHRAHQISAWAIETVIVPALREASAQPSD